MPSRDSIAQAEYDHETVVLVQEAEERVSELRTKHEVAAIKAKAAKEALNDASAALEKLIRERKTGLDENGQGLIPFGSEGDSKTKGKK